MNRRRRIRRNSWQHWTRPLTNWPPPWPCLWDVI